MDHILKYITTLKNLGTFKESIKKTFSILEVHFFCIMLLTNIQYIVAYYFPIPYYVMRI